ncbi:hypothetical protein C8R48DRAFT_678357 [Suillus tomentosus]|nr:hypothetical protein C8R48DRAFT_678357 [Suillus tomentosus]
MSLKWYMLRDVTSKSSIYMYIGILLSTAIFEKMSYYKWAKDRSYTVGSTNKAFSTVLLRSWGHPVKNADLAAIIKQAFDPRRLSRMMVAQDKPSRPNYTNGREGHPLHRYAPSLLIKQSFYKTSVRVFQPMATPSLQPPAVTRTRGKSMLPPDVAVHAVRRCANLQLAPDRDLKMVPQGGSF